MRDEEDKDLMRDKGRRDFEGKGEGFEIKEARRGERAVGYEALGKRLNFAAFPSLFSM